MSVPETSVRRPVTVFVATLAVSVFGYLSLRQLPVDLLPDLSYPTLTVQTEYPDAAPISVEQFVTRPVEEAVGVIPGVRDMRSTSRAGLSEVVLEFEWEENMDVAALDVREKLGIVELPREVEPSRVLRFDPSLDPVMRLAFSGNAPLDDLRQVAERWMKPRLEAIKGVAAAKVRGGLDPEIQVDANEDRLAAYGLTLEDLATAIAAENINRPGGMLRDWGAVYLVRTLHEFENLEQVRRTAVRESPQGRIRVEDVATVARGHKDREEITRSGGREAVEIALHREGSANTVAISEAIREELAQLREEMPAGQRLEILTDQARYISDAVRQVWSAAILGGILAILVIFFFLRDPVPTGIIALTIPISVLATFLFIQRAGVSLNIMSLGGLALGVGMLVDNAIVVLEAIDRRRREGHSRADAARRGAGEVAGAVTASTMTTVAVFFPIVFVRGVAGQLFYDLAVTVCLSLVASLVASLTIIPSLAALDPGALRSGSRTLFSVGPEEQPPPPIWTRAWSLAKRAWGFIVRWRRGGIGGWLLNVPLLPVRLVLLLVLPVILLSVVVFRALQWLSDKWFPLLSRARLGPLALAPLGDPRHPTARIWTVWLILVPIRPALLLVGALVGVVWWAFTWLFHTLAWAPTKGFDEIARRYPPALGRALRHRALVVGGALAVFIVSLGALPLLGTQLVPDLAQGEFAFRVRMPEGTPLETTSQIIERVEGPLAEDARFARVFSVIGSLPSAASGQQTIGENLAQINFVLREDAGPEEEADAIGRVREVLSLFPDLAAELVHPSVLIIKSPVAVQVFSDDLNVLDRAAVRVADAVRHVAGIEDVATTVEPGSPEIRIELDRERAGALGVQADQVSQSLRRQIRGEVVGQFREGEERIDIRVRASERARDRASEVEALRIRLPNGTMVPVSAVADVIVDRGPASIHRSGGARVAEISAKTTAGDLGRVLGEVRASVARLDLPSGTVAEMAGQDRDLKVSFDSLKLALGLAMFLVYVVMAVQFESLVHPFVILLSVPLGIVGAIAALLVTGKPVSVLALIGVVMLTGIVVNNAIVLIDAVNRRRHEGQALDEALVSAGRERLRPILMTTATTVLGLSPMALGLGAGDELRAPLAVTVIGGLLLSTLLTLVVIPCMYRLFARGIREQSKTPAASGLASELGGGGQP